MSVAALLPHGARCRFPSLIAAREPLLAFAWSTRTSAMQRLLPVAASPRTNGLGHLEVVQARASFRHHRPLTGVLLT
jgi:hypothetical protein